MTQKPRFEYDREGDSLSIIWGAPTGNDNVSLERSDLDVMVNDIDGERDVIGIRINDASIYVPLELFGFDDNDDDGDDAGGD